MLETEPSSTKTPIICAEIAFKHGESLYGKNMHASAMQQYLLTIGNIEPSQIIRKFLDPADLPLLRLYLETLHLRSLANPHHTTLLLTTYTESPENLEAFLTSDLNMYNYNVETALRVCRASKMYNLALMVARKHGLVEDEVKILVSDLSDYKGVVQRIRHMIIDQRGMSPQINLPDRSNGLALLKSLVERHARVLIRNEGPLFIDVMIELVVEGVFDIHKLVSYINVCDVAMLCEFLEGVLNAKFNIDVQKQDDQNFPPISLDIAGLQVVNDELGIVCMELITVYATLADSDQASQKCIRVLSECFSGCDVDACILVFRNYGLDKALVYVLEKTRKFVELAEYYCLASDEMALAGVCVVSNDLSVWRQSVKYYFECGGMFF